ncbi:hypothetical protein [Leucobacter chinensis]|uniref:hypothetical protein n=1 Tax=Leucobacter chinensis TaxID=2851010 RepID=UPI001C22B49E|nr:hypothetical protein [Leucobacter chinensis]
MSVQDKWQSLSQGNKRLLVVAMVLVVMVVVAGLIGLGMKIGAGEKPKADQGVTTSEESTAGDAKEGEPAPEEDAEPEAQKVDGFGIEVDDRGLGVMPVTKDPAEAAVAAAQLAFTVNLAKNTRTEFFDEVIQRMTHPTPEYKGAEGEVHTMVVAQPFEKTQRYYWAPEKVLHEFVKGAGLQDDPEAWWWILSNSTVYENLAWIPDLQITAKPLEVLSEEEMLELYPKAVPKIKDETDMTPDTPGATLSQWWVLLEVDGIQGESAAPRYQYPAHFAIYCDAPEDGGVCGVAYSIVTDFPPEWLRR